MNPVKNRRSTITEPGRIAARAALAVIKCPRCDRASTSRPAARFGDDALHHRAVRDRGIEAEGLLEMRGRLGPAPTLEEDDAEGLVGPRAAGLEGDGGPQRLLRLAEPSSAQREQPTAVMRALHARAL